MGNNQRLLMSRNLLFLFQVVLLAKGDNESIAVDTNKECKSPAHEILDLMENIFDEVVVCKLDAGSTGLPRFTGMRGDSGEKGDKGDMGSTLFPGLLWMKGNPGEKGDKGNRGFLGLPGIKGDFGEKGDKGDEGSAGFPGLPGMKGNSGVQGDKGDMGSAGFPGVPGLGGYPGEKGDKGDEGSAGFPGLPGLKGESGEKGDKGDTGSAGLPGLPELRGDSGEKGDKGDMGYAGLPGLPGSKGDSGEKGDKGDTGYAGLPGLPGSKGDSGEKGDKGDTGPVGPPGYQGPMGIPGMKGNSGEKGERGGSGPPGRPGKCGSCGEGSSDPDVMPAETYGTVEQPADNLCKDVDLTILPENGEGWVVGRESEPIHVNCKEMGTATCITGLKLDGVTFGKEETKPFWLSQKGLIINTATNLTLSQLQWLQERSSSVSQTIRYHCKNSQPFHRDNLEKSILLLTLNNIVIGPEPSLSTPLFYSVPEERDECSRASKDEWSHTDIIIEMGFIQRLPVVDFLIRDVKNEDQEVQIESVEICFE